MNDEQETRDALTRYRIFNAINALTLSAVLFVIFAGLIFSLVTNPIILGTIAITALIIKMIAHAAYEHRVEEDEQIIMEGMRNQAPSLEEEGAQKERRHFPSPIAPRTAIGAASDTTQEHHDDLTQRL